MTTPGHDRHRVRRGRTLLAALAAILWVAAHAPAAAQGPACALRVQPQPGSTGYRSREHRCEGMYVGLQSGSRSVQVISLARGGLRYDLPGAPGVTAGDTLLLVHVPPLPPGMGARAGVAVLGSTRESNLNWALDAVVAGGQALRWNLGDVIVPRRLASGRIGIVAHAGDPGVAEGEGVYVPVEIRGHARASAPGDSTELVIRIAVAAGVRWSTEGMSTMRDAERLNADGYFRIMLPPVPTRGEQRITLRWRVRGDPGWKAPEQLRLYRWE